MTGILSENLVAALDRGACVITANDRLARSLRLELANHHQRNGLTVWARPSILAWPVWLQQCLDALLDRALSGSSEPPPTILNVRQAEAVWESVINQSNAGRGLLQTAATASAAADAWDLICGWQVPLSALDPDVARTGDDAGQFEDTHAFADWARAYEHRSRREGWLDQSRLADYLARVLPDGHLPMPPELLLAGFDELRPQQQALLQAAEQAGTRVTQVAGPALTPEKIEQYACADTEAECRAAAAWARDILLRQADARIGIVVHDLASNRHLIMRVLDEALRPATRLAHDVTLPAPYNLSLGQPLAELPLVHDALAWLEWGAGPVDWKTASALLRSPFLAGAETERDARARLDAAVRRRGQVRIGLEELCYRAEKASDCPQLAKHLRRARECLQQQPVQQSAGEHAAACSRFLNAIGWSRGRSLNSHEYQVVQAWWDLLAQYASLDAFIKPQNWKSALGRLCAMAGRELFQPQSAPAPVQVLGVLEASGQTFDYLWIIGLHDGHWPASPRPHPFLPVHLQRQYRMPHASAERELQFAELTSQRLLSSASRIVISWPEREGDADLRPSPLFNAIAVADQLPEPIPRLARIIQQRCAGSIAFTDHAPPPLVDSEPVHGGTAVLKNQSACPFRAFATHRLHAAALEEPVPGLDAMARGSLVHGVMQVIWEVLVDQSALQQDAALLRKIVEDSVERAVVTWEQENHYPLPARFRRVECVRLADLASAWLQLDAQRAPFTVVERETKQELAIGGLSLRGRIDRLDQLADGRYLIVDYKTGKVDPKVWLDERPEDPQLPLYALKYRNQLAGVAFAQLRIGDLKYDGVATEAGLVPDLPSVAEWKARPADCEDMPALLEYWQAQLTVLASAFRAGKATVDPRDPRQTCKYCDLGLLCRIDELSQGRHDLEADNSDG